MSHTAARTHLVFALSPVALTALCAFVQFVTGSLWGAWAWVPTAVVFWGGIALIVHLFPGSPPRERFRKPTGAFAWSVLAVLAGLFSIHGFLRHWGTLNSPQLVTAWLVFALVNPWFEESYWRGLLIDSTASWGKLASLSYSALWFAASHPLIWGVHSLPLRKPEAVGALLLVGLIWGLVYQRSMSLRWCVAGHMLANLFGLAPLVLLNLYDPTIR